MTSSIKKKLITFGIADITLIGMIIWMIKG